MRRDDLNQRLWRVPRPLLIVSALAAAGGLTWIGLGAQAAPATTTASGTVLQTNLVSDLPGVAAVTDPNLVNPWGVADTPTSPFWVSDNNGGQSTLYQVPGAASTPVSVNPQDVNIPTPVSLTGGTPTGTAFNPHFIGGAFQITGLDVKGTTMSGPALFLFATEDGTIVGWNPFIDPTGKFAGPGGTSDQAVVAVNNSGAVYTGLAIATGTTPIIPADAASTTLLYASNFRAGTIDVYDANFSAVTLSAGAFTDPRLPTGYAPFNVQVMNGKVYVTYAKRSATGPGVASGPHRGFVDVFNLDGTPGLPGGQVRLISRGPLDSPWGMVIAPPDFAGFSAPGNDPVLLVGNFGNGRVHAFDATNGSELGQLADPNGEPIHISGLRALKTGNNQAGGAANTVYFTAGPFDETHGLFGSLTTAASGSPAGPAGEQLVTAYVDVFQSDLRQVQQDLSSGAAQATVKRDTQTLDAALSQLDLAERAFAAESLRDPGAQQGQAAASAT
jgi:uncharacterized protein (TIGR03118 family)